MNLIDRVKNILMTPKTEWDVINGETETPQSLLTSYVIPLAVIAALGNLIQGFLFAGTSSLKHSLVMAGIALITHIIGYYISTYVIDMLAPSFDSEKNLGKSAQLVAYASTPVYIAALLSFVPFVSLLIMIAGAVYSIYLMFIGIGPLKKTSEDKKVVYMILAFVVMMGVYFIISAILVAILITSMGFGLGAAKSGLGR